MTLAQELAARLPMGTRLTFGQLLLSCLDDGTYEARHHEDADADAGLMKAGTVRELREIAKYDSAGDYRPLKTAPSLRPGWTTETRLAHEFLERIDAIYPGVFATAIAHEKNQLEPVPLRDTLARQTGMYRFAGTITDPMAREIVEELCGPGCLRTIRWTIGSETTTARLKTSPDSIPLLCTEACTFAVSRARELAKEAHSRATSEVKPEG